MQEDVLAVIEFEFSVDRFEVTIWDHGPGFDHGQRDLSKMPPDLMRERGRGLYMMSAFCDDIAFVKRDGLFGVKLTKIPREAEAPDSATG